MEGFETKKALLQYLGKDENDRKLVDRLISRGEVYMENGMYYISSKEEKIKELEFLVEKLRGEITTIKESNWDLEGAKVQCEYWERMYNEEVADKQNRIRKCFRRIQQIKPRADWEEFRDWVLSDEEL